jgi:acyl-CoA thioester hydrolase
VTEVGEGKKVSSTNIIDCLRTTLARRSRGTGEPTSRSSIFVSKKTSHRPGLLLIHALAVQRPNGSNPLGLCCDIVYHANYLRFMERGRTNHLRLMGAEQHALFAEAETETPGFAFVVRSMKIDFLKPARMDDVLDVVTWPVAVKGASISLAQEVRRGEDELVTAEVRVAFTSEGRAQLIPKSIRALMKADLE